MVRVEDNHLSCTAVLAFIAACFALMLPVIIVTAAQASSSPLLLSLDVEIDSDVDALSKLNLTVPATYFVTGEFARKHPEQVRVLSKAGTIGSHSHSHPNLTNLELEAVKKDLLNSMQALESATGRSPIWFRAPYLEINDEVLAVAREIGFRYDSSETERWVKQAVLNELPISINTTGRILFSDYDIFSVYGVDDEMALDMLQENYLTRLETGRPFIFLLHPSLIVKHADVLHRFINFVHEQGGSCLSFDQYLKRMFQDHPIDVGIRVDPSRKGLEVNQIVENLVKLKITDAFILARDKSGKEFYHTDPTWDGTTEKNFRGLVRGLYQSGIRVYAELPVLVNEYAIKHYPDLAMIDGKGTISREWISPSHPHTLSNLEQYVSNLLEELPFHGIHLDAIKFPRIDADFSPMAVKRFQQDTGVVVPLAKAASLLPGDYYSEWITWRFQQIGNVIQVAAIAASRNRRDVVISANLDSSSLINFESMESSGQNYSLLARYLDMITTNPDYSPPDSFRSTVNNSLHISRTMIGDTPLFIGMPLEIGDVNSISFLELSAMIRGGAEGILFPSYYHLFSVDQEKSHSGIDKLKEVIDWFRSPVTDSAQHFTTGSSIFVEEVLASLQDAGSIKTETGLTVAQDRNGGKKSALLLIAFVAISVLAAFLVHTKAKRARDNKQNHKNTSQVSFDVNRVIKLVKEGTLTGPMVHSVAMFLRAFDPISSSRFRTAYILDLATESNNPITVQEMLKLTADIPGWQVLAMSYIKEAIMHNYLCIDQGQLTITPKGRLELDTVKANGFDSQQWLFVEERLHEILNVTCPQCGNENSTHWYWTSFTCSTCNRDIELCDCNDIVCKSVAGIELNQYSVI